jgi:hypothetical protein
VELGSGTQDADETKLGSMGRNPPAQPSRPLDYLQTFAMQLLPPVQSAALVHSAAASAGERQIFCLGLHAEIRASIFLHSSSVLHGYRQKPSTQLCPLAQAIPVPHPGVG